MKLQRQALTNVFQMIGIQHFSNLIISDNKGLRLSAETLESEKASSDSRSALY